jgi:hypothetical protein
MRLLLSHLAWKIHLPSPVLQEKLQLRSMEVI